MLPATRLNSVSPVTPDAASNGDPNDDRTDPRVKKLQAQNGAKQQALDNMRKGKKAGEFAQYADTTYAPVAHCPFCGEDLR